MSRLRLVAVECNYKKIDRQLKEQFVHWLHDNDMLAEIIREINKAEESADITIEQVLGWAKRVVAQRAQSAILNSLTKTKGVSQGKDRKKGDSDTIGEMCMHMPKCPQRRDAVIVVLAIHPDNAWLMGRSV